MADIPPIRPSGRAREWDNYSNDQRARIVREYLFNGLTHRELDRNVLGLESDDSLGFQAMGILHYLGLGDQHKNIFSGQSIQEAIDTLTSLKDPNTKPIVDTLRHNIPPNSPPARLEYPFSCHSWLIESPNDFVKTLDKSAFLHRGSGIPSNIKFLFDANNLQHGDTQVITLEYGDQRFAGEITLSADSRARIFWNNDFATLLANLFPEVHAAYSNEDQSAWIDTPKMRFMRHEDGNVFRIIFEQGDPEDHEAWSPIYQISNKISDWSEKLLTTDDPEILRSLRSAFNFVTDPSMTHWTFGKSIGDNGEYHQDGGAARERLIAIGYRNILEDQDNEMSQYALRSFRNWAGQISSTDFISRLEATVEGTAKRKIKLLVPPTTAIPGNPEVNPPVGRSIKKSRRRSFNATQRDLEKTDADNKQLGLAGEKWVLNHEKSELTKAGLKDLAEQVEHVSQTQGDGLGYDILSFSSDGTEKHIEVKTTNRGINTAFFLTPNELSYSDEHPANFFLYRLFTFSTNPRFYRIKGSLTNGCLLTPTAYSALPMD